MVNIVIFGETGAGKSAVINLMAGRQVARTSPNSHRCTLQWTEYTITLNDGTRYQVFDTVGLEEPRLDSGEYLTAITNADSLIKVLNERGGINLLIFCVRGGRVTTTMQSNYRLFFEFFCQEKVPLVLVATNLEREERMEDWYTRNVGHLEKYCIRSVGHACITAATTIDGRHRARYEESRVTVCSLVRAHCNTIPEGWTGGQGWLASLVVWLLDFTTGRPKKTDVIGVLTKRCGMSKAAAQQVAQQIRSEEFSRGEPYLAHGNDRKTTPRMIQSGAPMSKIQGVTQQETQPESPTPSYLNVRLDRAPDMRTRSESLELRYRQRG
ncbi:hypothetical protein M405DRAFT_916751 [Rhizopogon salebrosus TDB-379]|nr:hypothetical protein M405DRAFT_916751 [Rhizopogon salebrosus TDB-379]